jgi:excisionase family DNA binding protein
MNGDGLQTDRQAPAGRAGSSDVAVAESRSATGSADVNGRGDVPLLLTPAQAAVVLAVPESWLRRKAGQRLIPCTFVGKHLRFSTGDVARIVDAGSQPVRRPRSSRRAR